MKHKHHHTGRELVLLLCILILLVVILGLLTYTLIGEKRIIGMAGDLQGDSDDSGPEYPSIEIIEYPTEPYTTGNQVSIRAEVDGGGVLLRDCRLIYLKDGELEWQIIDNPDVYCDFVIDTIDGSYYSDFNATVTDWDYNTGLYEGDFAFIENTAPTTPLNGIPPEWSGGNNVIISWDASIDNETQQIAPEIFPQTITYSWDIDKKIGLDLYSNVCDGSTTETSNHTWAGALQRMEKHIE